MKYYFIQVWGCVEPCLHGPYDTQEERDKAYKDKWEEEGGDAEHTFFALKGDDIDVEYCGEPYKPF